MSSAVARISNANRTNQRKQNYMSNYHKLYTPQDSAVVFIDFQPQMTFGVANIDRATLINNVTLLAKVAKEFKAPTMLTAVENRILQRIRPAPTAGRLSAACSAPKTPRPASRRAWARKTARKPSPCSKQAQFLP